MREIVLSGIAFLSGFFTAIFAEPLRRRIYAPRLKLKFGKSNHYLTRTPENEHEAIYVRIKVENYRSTLAKSCRAYLVNIERKVKSGDFDQTEYCDSMQLGWAYQKNRRFDAIDLPRKVSHFVDIISTRPTSSGFKLETKVIPLLYKKMLVTPGVYRFTIIVSGDGVKPAHIKPIVSWNGNWDQVNSVEYKVKKEV